MRTARIAILTLFLAASLFLLCRSVVSLHQSNAGVPPATAHKSTFRALFSFTATFGLFAPNAAISLTDDNSTFFPARPAAYGPPLPPDGLSGQLWIGSGFADDGESTEGELGCSDVPGWEDGWPELAVHKAPEQAATASSDKSPAGTVAKAKNTKDSAKRDQDAAGRAAGVVAQRQGQASPQLPPPPKVDDGTDDYLHEGLQQPNKQGYKEGWKGSGPGHADIQSIQETAEITGKVVLLSRGGCGFLEKTKWAQRRGAIALIVGDNQKGGPLVQMFARGDVDNITIPSVFTSRTSAHLLSSLMQPGSFIEDILDENGHPVLKVQQPDKSRRNKKNKEAAPATSTSSAPAAKKSTTSKPKTPGTPAAARDDAASPSTADKSESASWLSRLFGWGTEKSAVSDRGTSPSSGRHDWVLVDEWSDEKDTVIKNGLSKANKNGGTDKKNGDKNRGDETGSEVNAAGASSAGDGFRIGVHDWRDPDLVGTPGQVPAASEADDKLAAGEGSAEAGSAGASTKPTGKKPGSGSANSITPGSGEYAPDVAADVRSPGATKPDGAPGSQGGLISKIFGDDDGADFVPDNADSPAAPIKTATPLPPPSPDDGSAPRHEGLWVTITPTSSGSPLFDTLLVLVVSPLITLTVVYALLVLRAKIRRRRWRAPKSVVERLPVRIYYQTVSPGHSPRLPSSPRTSSPTTPLLQGSSRPRPRSRTTTGVPEEAADLLLRVDSAQLQGGAAASSSRSPPVDGSSQWTKFMGRQSDCAVCLEEYVDGVSRVMSLPCGHEFHVECITPWLTTRRRTCPICKGDVVRSLARGAPSSSVPRYDPYQEDDSDYDDDVTDNHGAQASASGAGAWRPSSPDYGLEDVQRPLDPPAIPRVGVRRPSNGGWFQTFAHTLGGSAPQRPRPGHRRDPLDTEPEGGFMA
ncbi:hypothetical protein QBC46DRAFT_16290 [Diplogelasinospora grovesii]|uniref:RING-type E3 ubiquitin transferase n=1 Tax=Diplogelasinospora grovesii TaxID=303347 RepID=A0AAN6NHZ1_9PEZI|nr:hypothetical protein QBC46DRAFT_16290 [Diplogelasinospora grovesii]